MKNTIQISVEFSFKGETFNPSAVIDLDLFVNDSNEFPDLHNIIAIQGDIDTYSYAFEVMQQSEVCFDNATGLALECLEDGHFNLQTYIEKRKESELQQLLQKIAKDILNIDDLSESPEIKNALILAYRLGKND